jgi:hypothetical protein
VVDFLGQILVFYAVAEISAATLPGLACVSVSRPATLAARGPTHSTPASES